MEDVEIINLLWQREEMGLLELVVSRVMRKIDFGIW